LVKLVKKIFPTRFSIAKLSKYSLFRKILMKLVFNGVDIIYLPKDDRLIEINKTIDTKNMILPSEIVKNFIQRSNHRFLMDFCICRDANKCEDYPRNLGCLFLGQASQDINPKLGREVSKQEAFNHVERCLEAGLISMIGIDKLDVMWLGVGPKNKLLSICACDPCCCLWKITPYLSKTLSSKVQKMPGIDIEVNKSKCSGCGICAYKVCFVDAITVSEDIVSINGDCKGCGRCVEVCPEHAIDLIISDEDYIEKSIQHIEPLVDLT
jgi:ferredoxin